MPTGWGNVRLPRVASHDTGADVTLAVPTPMMWWLGVGSMLVACSAAGSDGGESTQVDKLVGGVEAPPGFLDATYLVGGRCTAVCVGDRMLLTAAHCVVEHDTETDRYYATPSVDFEPGMELAITNAKVLEGAEIDDVQIAEIHLAPEWVDACTNGCADLPAGHDLAVIETAFTIDDAVLVAAVDLSPVAAGDVLLKVGYGCEAGYRAGGDPRRLKVDIARAIASPVLGRQTEPGAHHTVFTPGRYASGHEASLCFGDSGGPLYRPSGIVAGINSLSLLRRRDLDPFEWVQDHFTEDPGLASTDKHASTASAAAWLETVLPETSLVRSALDPSYVLAPTRSRIECAGGPELTIDHWVVDGVSLGLFSDESEPSRPNELVATRTVTRGVLEVSLQLTHSREDHQGTTGVRTRISGRVDGGAFLAEAHSRRHRVRDDGSVTSLSTRVAHVSGQMTSRGVLMDIRETTTNVGQGTEIFHLQTSASVQDTHLDLGELGRCELALDGGLFEHASGVRAALLTLLVREQELALEQQPQPAFLEDL